ncbi:MAG: hypothetical protein WCZ90_10575 [Melioribacteraceae bacterium]
MIASPRYIKCFSLFIIILVMAALIPISAQTVNLKKEYAATLEEMCDALLKLQIHDSNDENYGALKCEYCNVLHTRAAEAIYPFMVMYKVSGDKKYHDAAIKLSQWLISQQQKDGSWKETPEEWTGTSTDQLLMMTLTYELIAKELGSDDKAAWKVSMEKAGDYLVRVMSPEFASINYVATTTATLASLHQVVPKNEYLNRAKVLAHRVISKMDEDGFINGEGGRSNNIKSGVDLGYDLEMSLWGLGYYAKLTKDELVNQYVKHALKNHLYFIYPDGSMDNSWGIRSNKWTNYGGATSDGCQVLFSMYSDDDPVYASAALKNLQFLKTCMKNGLVGYGSLHWEVFNKPLCIYPTFTKAKNIALAYMLESNAIKKSVLLPTEKPGWIKYFKTLDVVEVRTKNIMATITSYGYKDYKANAKSKYMYRPSGGAISNLWIKDHGYLQASSVTNYSRPEPMSFPEAPGIISLSPRIEFEDSVGYFTNLFEFDSKLEIQNSKKNIYSISATGELKDKFWYMGGVAYKYDYRFDDNSYTKTITLTYHDAKPLIKVIEPFVNYPGMTFIRKGNKKILIGAEKRKFEFTLIEGEAEIVLGRNSEKYWAPYPALKAFPIELVISKPVSGFTKKISYEVRIIE